MPKSPPAPARVNAPVLDKRSLPSQERSRSTYELILATTGELLAEVGFERLSTNLVCERAGLTPPALYRYFPNKYAILAELARRLMDAQDQVFFAWLDAGGAAAGALESSVEANVRLRRDLLAVTRDHPGGIWILRAIRAVPLLQEVRVTSRDQVIDRHVEHLAKAHPDIPESRLRMAARLSEQVSYAAIEMLMEDPDLDEARIIEETSWMTCLYYDDFARRAKTSEPD